MSVFDNIFTDPDYDQLSNLVRWNGLNRNNNESVAHHSFIVTWFSRIIIEELLAHGHEEFKLDVITYACFHDFDEMFSGDIAHGVKYNDFNGKEIKELINNFCKFKTEQKFNDNTSPSDLMMKKNLLENISPKVKSIVKLADWLSMSFYVKKEINLGNKDLFEQYDYCAIAVRESCIKCNDIMTEIYGKDFNGEILRDISNLKFSKYGR